MAVVREERFLWHFLQRQVPVLVFALWCISFAVLVMALLVNQAVECINAVLILAC